MQRLQSVAALIDSKQWLRLAEATETRSSKLNVTSSSLVARF